MENKITKVERCMDRLEGGMDRLEGGMDRLEDSFCQLQETIWRFIERIDPCFAKEQRARSEKRQEEVVEKEKKEEAEEEKAKEEEETEGGEKAIEEEDQDRSKITKKKEHLHLDVSDQILEKTQPMGQSHKLSNGSKTIFTIITEEISEEELPQSVPDRRRPRIRCRSFTSACGDTIVDVNDSNQLNAAENEGVVVLKIKSGFNILIGEKEEEEEQIEEGGRGAEEIGKEEEEDKMKKFREKVGMLTVPKLNGVGCGNGLQTTWPNSKITESQNGLVDNRESRNEFSLINQIRPNNTAQSGLNQHTQTQSLSTNGGGVHSNAMNPYRGTGGAIATSFMIHELKMPMWSRYFKWDPGGSFLYHFSSFFTLRTR